MPEEQLAKAGEGTEPLLVAGEVVPEQLIASVIPQKVEGRRAFLKTLFGGSVLAALVYQEWRISELSQQVEEMDMAELARRVLPAAVSIMSMDIGERGELGSSGGSGFFVRDIQGRVHLVAANHILGRMPLFLGGGGQCAVMTSHARGRSVPGTVFASAPVRLANGRPARSPERDIVLLQIPTDVRVGSAVGLSFRDCERDPPASGERVMVVGSPLGLAESVSVGVVSHAARRIPQFPLNNGFQVDAPSHPGSSGGCVVDSKGRLIGMVEAVPAADERGLIYAENIVFVTRADTIAQVLEGWGVRVLGSGPREAPQGEL